MFTATVQSGFKTLMAMLISVLVFATASTAERDRESNNRPPPENNQSIQQGQPSTERPAKTPETRKQPDQIQRNQRNIERPQLSNPENKPANRQQVFRNPTPDVQKPQINPPINKTPKPSPVVVNREEPRRVNPTTVPSMPSSPAENTDRKQAIAKTLDSDSRVTVRKAEFNSDRDAGRKDRRNDKPDGGDNHSAGSKNRNDQRQFENRARTKIINNNVTINRHIDNKQFVNTFHNRDRADIGPHGLSFNYRFTRMHRNELVYFNSHHMISNRIITPSYNYVVYYNYGPWRSFRYVHPYYHRKFVFVSLCGYWPADYTYARYYWYDYHPYAWYGDNPIPYEVSAGDTYNYYTYNYNYPDTAQNGTVTSGTYNNTTIDASTFADVREKMAKQKQQAQEPSKPTPTDNLFDEAVKAFEAGDYNSAAEKFGKAMNDAPEDMIIPFAFAQSLFAKQQYQQAAMVLRAALEKVTPDKEGVFYPRGLYSDDKVLLDQIDVLKSNVSQNGSDPDLQLLLGYNLLGIGELDQSEQPLQKASVDPQNSKAATTLLNLLDKINTEKNQNN